MDCGRKAAEETIMEDVSNEEDEESTGVEDESEAFADQHEQVDSRSAYEADVGIFEKIRLENFMSHHLFEFVFGSNVNIICGQNGSGKSAIIAALQIGLGARTSSADRGKSVSSYVRNGASSGTIKIQIRNRKVGEVDNRYNPHLYGDSIIVERKLVRTGSGGGWTFRDRNDRKVKLQGIAPREELTRILDHFNLRVENPIAVLTQQKSKQFLSSGKDTDRYKFFMEATGLQQVKSELIAIARVKTEISQILDKKKSFVEEIEKGLAELKKRYDLAQEMSTLEGRIEELESLWAWTLVAEEEDTLEKHKEQVKIFEERIQEHQNNAEICELEVQRSRAQVDSLNEEINTATQKIRAQTQKMNSTRTELRSLKQEISIQGKEINACDSAIRDAARRASKLEDDLRAARAKHEQGNSALHDIEKDLEEKQAEKRRSEANVEAMEAELAKLVEQLHRVRDDMQGVDREIQKSGVHEDRARSEAQQYQKSQGNSLSKWGRHILELQSKIDKAFDEGKFKKKPIGPVGAYVNVKEEEWARAIQHCLGSTLSAYLVDNSHDQGVLRKLVPQRSYQAIIQTQFDARYDIPKSARAPHGLYAVMDAITVSEDPVFNVLIDQGEIEKQILVKSHSEATMYAEREHPNIRKCWLPDGSQMYTRNSAAVYRSGERHLPVLLAQDMTDQINALLSRADDLAREGNELRARKSSIQRERDDLSQKELTLTRGSRDTRKRISQLDFDISRLQSTIEERSSEFDSSSWDAQIAQTREDAEEQGRKKEDLTKKIGDLKEAMSETNNTLDNDKDLLQSLGDELEDLKRNLDESSDAYRKAVASSSQGKARTEKLKAMKDDAMQALQSFEEKLQKEIESAMQLAPERIYRGQKTSSQLESDIKRLKAKLRGEQERHAGRSLLEIEKEYIEAKQRKAKNDHDLRKMDEHLRRVHTGYSARKKKYLRMRHQTKVETNVHFKYFMAKRRHMGELIFDDKGGENGEGTLRLNVAMSNHKKKDGGRYRTGEMTGLSGGERNYTTFCFMLALGESINVPVRIMDEFDVFMDAQNRRSCYETLIDVSKDMPGRQFVFVSPLELPNVQASLRVKIQKLAPPERPGVRQQYLEEFVNVST